jgi:hypothetical protein
MGNSLSLRQPYLAFDMYVFPLGRDPLNQRRHGMQFESHNSLVFVVIVKRYAESGSASSRCEGFVTVLCLLTTLL